ncbi:MAG: type II secretion system F family protein [Treponema sp.]|nr:type II secretion system F family protein [Treponema sp.]
MIKRITDALDELFVKQGLELSQALEAISRGKSLRLRKTAGFLLEALKEGNLLSNALSECPYITFNPLYISFVMLAEKSGNLTETVAFLKARCDRQHESRVRLAEVSVYPLFIILIAFFAGGFLLKYTGNQVDSSIIWAFLLLLLLSFAVFLIIWKCLKEDSLLDAFFAVDFLLHSGHSIASAIGFAAELVGVHSRLGVKFTRAKVKLEYGIPLSEALLLKRRDSELLYYAEKGDRRNDVFSKLAALQKERYLQRRKICLSLIEPVFISFTGVFLLILVIHIFMPFMNDMNWL